MVLTCALAVLAAGTAAPSFQSLLNGKIDEATLLANGGVYEQLTPDHPTTKKLMKYSANLADEIRRATDDSAESRQRRSSFYPTVYSNYTSCSACIGANKFWNGVACVDEDSVKNAFMFLGGFWGPGRESDCTKKTSFSVTSSAGCGENHDAFCSSSSEKFGSFAMKMSMASTVGSDLGFSGTADNGFFVYQDLTNPPTRLFDAFDVAASQVEFANGELSIGNGPTTPHLQVQFAVIPKGTFGNGPAGATMIRSYIVADAYYFFDNTTCPTGITASGNCKAETQLTQENTYSLAKGAGWTFRATGPRVDTAVANESDAKKSVYTFCANNPSTTVKTVDTICFRFSVLYVAFPSFNFNNPKTGPAQDYATYSCGSYSANITLFDYKADILFDNVTYPSANHRLGFRIVSASQTGKVTFSEDEDAMDEGDEEVFSEGPVSIGMGTKILTSSTGRATCGDNEVASAVSNTNGGILTLTSAATGTSCGVSNWYNAQGKATLDRVDVKKIGCVFGSFTTASQPSYILFDPTLSTNETAAKSVVASISSGASALSLSYVTIMVVVMFNAIFVTGF